MDLFWPTYTNSVTIGGALGLGSRCTVNAIEETLKPLDERIGWGGTRLFIKLCVLDSSAEEVFHQRATASMHADWDEVDVTAIFCC